jgi:predicted acetyltransferase
MDIRITTIDDLQQVKKLWAYCFENYEPFFSWYFREYYQEENTLGAFLGNKLLSSLQLIPYNIYLRGSVLPTSYIVGVASFPESRGGGIVGKLMQEALVELRKRKHGVSLLMPFQAGFYYPFNFEICYHHYKYEIKLEDLRPVASVYGDFVEIEGTDNITELNKVYQQFVQERHGFIIRSPRNWRLLLEEHIGEKGFSYLLQKEGNFEGYILYYLKDNKMIIREMAYTNYKAQKSLFKFIYDHRSQVEYLEWNAPLDDSTFYFLKDPKKGITLYPFLTARIVDVAEVLSTISYPKEINTELVFRVKDNLAPWNNNVFHLTVVNGRAKIQETKRPPNFIIDIGAFSQLVFGRLSVGDLKYQGRLDIYVPESKILLE